MFLPQHAYANLMYCPAAPGSTLGIQHVGHSLPCALYNQVEREQLYQEMLFEINNADVVWMKIQMWIKLYLHLCVQ